MRFRISAQHEPAWPPGAWLAVLRPGEPVVRLRHGSQVEVREQWFCEAAWDGEFGSGEFHATDLFFGSGARVLGNGQLMFVSSGSTVDRLQHLHRGGAVYVSNSLVCLVACTESRLDLSFGSYPEFFRSITRGIDSYDRTLPLQSGSVVFTYFANLVWDGASLREVHKPDPARDFSTFDKYRQFLGTALAHIAKNMRDPRRRHRYEMVGALSSGYDSTTVTVLAREVGLQRVFSFINARGGREDHGTQTAKLLGLDIALIERTAWRQQPFAEIPYFAATGLGPDVIFSGASDLLRGQVLMTGFHGDKLWGKLTKALGRNIVRGDASGLSFTEHRLMLGALHMPIAFMGVRDIAQIHALSNSSELEAWDVADEYSRPICRRIVEEAGVPRDWFGRRKVAATSLFHKGESRLGAETEHAFHQWLRDANRLHAATAPGPEPPPRALLTLRDHYHLVQSLVSRLRRLSGPGLSQKLAAASVAWEREINRRVNPVEMLFPFAVDRMRGLYQSPERITPEARGLAGAEAH